jgi:hypothetical protein
MSVKIFAQQADSIKRQFTVDLELRPRIEYRYNHVQVPNDTISPYLFATQRNRLSMAYARGDRWKISAEFQEIHEWDKNKSNSKVASVNFYQLYLEYKSNSLKIRAGRQGVLLDNGRIFSDAPWSQQGRAHEGLRVTKAGSKYSQDLFLLFTRNYGKLFEPAYSPVASHRYQYLLIHHLKYDDKNHFAFNTINALEVFEGTGSQNSMLRMTSGGRLEFEEQSFYSTVNSYLQFGQNAQGKNVFGYYLQPEIRFSKPKYTLRIGTEIISGSKPNVQTNNSGSFDIRYGVAWKFMGNMNIFTRFPDDLNDRGLINPYLFAMFPLTKKMSIRSDSHLFYAQFPLENSNKNYPNKYLGYEHDISFKYMLTKNTELNYGISYFLSADAMAALPKIQNIEKIALWNYLMLSYKISALKF